MKQLYNVAEYIRLSRKDGDKIESDSIGNQRDLLDSYISTHSSELTLYDRYIDDDYTGTNFDRPRFKDMIKDIESGLVNCVIVKDLSRFGRDYIEVGNYLQKVFPKLKVRFIAVNDSIDSTKQAYDMTMPFKNIFNEQYARDISKKVLTTMQTKQRNGLFIGAFASYGYLKDPNNKGKLIVDPYAAEIVKRIFKMFIDGHGKMNIARTLNKEKILCPSEYKKSLNMKYHNANRLNTTSYWTYSAIYNILQNEMYCGNMVQHKNNHSRYRDNASRLVDKEDWIIVPNTHEAIISKEVWETAQSLLKRRTRDMGLNQNVTMFAGFLQCADCGRSLAKIQTGNRIRYVCGTYKNYSSEYCTSHRIFEDELIEILLTLINQKIKQVKNIVAYIERAEKQQSKKKDNIKVAKSIEKLNIQLAKISNFKKGLYEDYKEGILSKEEYTQFKNDYQKQEEDLILQINTLKDIEIDEVSTLRSNPWVQNFKDYQEISELTRPILAAFIKVIKVHENNELEVIYNFSDDLLNEFHN